MKNYMIVKQQVQTLRQFQAAFDNMKQHRAAAGLTDLGQFCEHGAPNTVIVVMEAADVGRAKEFWHSVTLAKGRQAAGIVGPLDATPEQVWLTDGLVRDKMGGE